MPEGALVAVVGSVGSGKSSLISAALGDSVKNEINSTSTIFSVIMTTPIHTAFVIHRGSKKQINSVKNILHGLFGLVHHSSILIPTMFQ